MNNKELISAISKAAQLHPASVELVLRALPTVAIDALTKGEDFKLPRLVNLHLRTHPARTSRNPKTGAKIEVPEKQRIHAAPLGWLKDAIDDKLKG